MITKVDRIEALEPILMGQPEGRKLYLRYIPDRDRHPIIQTPEKFTEMIDRLSQKAEVFVEAGEKEKSDEIYHLFTNLHLLIYHGNIYHGLPLFCDTCDEPVLIQSESGRHINHNVFMQNPNTPFVGLTHTGIPFLVSRNIEYGLDDHNHRRITLVEFLQELWGPIRKQITQICIALQDLSLSAFELLQIVDHAIPRADRYAMGKKWNIIVAIKHFKKALKHP